MSGYLEELSRNMAFREIGAKRGRLARAMRKEREKPQPDEQRLARASVILAQFDTCLAEWLASWDPSANGRKNPL